MQVFTRLLTNKTACAYACKCRTRLLLHLTINLFCNYSVRHSSITCNSICKLSQYWLQLPWIQVSVFSACIHAHRVVLQAGSFRHRRLFRLLCCAVSIHAERIPMKKTGKKASHHREKWIRLRAAETRTYSKPFSLH